jgi:hypothetical protein
MLHSLGGSTTAILLSHVFGIAHTILALVSTAAVLTGGCGVVVCRVEAVWRMMARLLESNYSLKPPDGMQPLTVPSADLAV